MADESVRAGGRGERSPATVNHGRRRWSRPSRPRRTPCSNGAIVQESQDESWRRPGGGTLSGRAAEERAKTAANIHSSIDLWDHRDRGDVGRDRIRLACLPAKLNRLSTRRLFTDFSREASNVAPLV
jgi:hypothetical protein